MDSLIQLTDRVFRVKYGPDAITRFRGEYEFLSTFYGYVVLDGVRYPTPLHAYQAQKTDDPYEINRIIDAPHPRVAHEIGQIVRAKRGFFTGDTRKYIMRRIIRYKFRYGTQLANRLMATGDKLLVDGNIWGRDQYFGASYNGGQNMHGRELMIQRAYLRAKARKILAVEHIQGAWRRYQYRKKIKAVTLIQKYWKEALVNPEYLVCRKLIERFISEFKV